MRLGNSFQVILQSSIEVLWISLEKGAGLCFIRAAIPDPIPLVPTCAWTTGG
jgi:hypothetical protein